MVDQCPVSPGYTPHPHLLTSQTLGDLKPTWIPQGLAAFTLPRMKAECILDCFPNIDQTRALLDKGLPKPCVRCGLGDPNEIAEALIIFIKRHNMRLI